MTRFEALGILPDKSIPCLKKTDAGKLKIALRITPERAVEEFDDGHHFRLITRDSQPELGFLLRITRIHQEGVYKTYVRPDQRKVKRNAKRFGWKIKSNRKAI